MRPICNIPSPFCAETGAANIESSLWDDEADLVVGRRRRRRKKGFYGARGKKTDVEEESCQKGLLSRDGMFFQLLLLRLLPDSANERTEIPHLKDVSVYRPEGERGRCPLPAPPPIAEQGIVMLIPDIIMLMTEIIMCTRKGRRIAQLLRVCDRLWPLCSLPLFCLSSEVGRQR